MDPRLPHGIRSPEVGRCLISSSLTSSQGVKATLRHFGAIRSLSCFVLVASINVRVYDPTADKVAKRQSEVDKTAEAALAQLTRLSAEQQQQQQQHQQQQQDQKQRHDGTSTSAASAKTADESWLPTAASAVFGDPVRRKAKAKAKAKKTR